MYVDDHGKQKPLYPGDWWPVGRQQARDGLRDGLLEILKPAVLQTVQDLTDCAIVLKGFTPELENSLVNRFPAVPIFPYGGTMPTSGRFLLWDTSANLRQDLILTGFGLLTKWQLAVPLLNYDTLASDVGMADEQAETKAVVHDLRVPIYNHRVLFVRQCQETRRLFELWQNGSELGFLQALYQARPIVNALPPSWIM
jgi:hypothetical protein